VVKNRRYRHGRIRTLRTFESDFVWKSDFCFNDVAVEPFSDTDAGVGFRRRTECRKRDSLHFAACDAKTLNCRLLLFSPRSPYGIRACGVRRPIDTRRLPLPPLPVWTRVRRVVIRVHVNNTCTRSLLLLLCLLIVLISKRKRVRDTRTYDASECINMYKRRPRTEKSLCGTTARIKTFDDYTTYFLY